MCIHSCTNAALIKRIISLTGRNILESNAKRARIGRMLLASLRSYIGQSQSILNNLD